MVFTSRQIIQTLNNAGFEAYYIGGCVRDERLNLKPTDYDIVTNAKSDELDNLFKPLGCNIKHIGKLFGVVQIDGYEVATYRSDTYNGTELIIGTVGSLKEDCIRRDFTINGLAKDLDGAIYDYTDGLKDLRGQIVKANGDPLVRFTEDPSRILRAIYFSIKLKFNIETNTFNVLKENIHLIKLVERNVIGRILGKVIKNGLFHQFVVRLQEYGMLNLVFGIDACPHLNLLENVKYYENQELLLYSILYTDSNLDADTIEQILNSYLIPKKEIFKINSIITHSKPTLLIADIPKHIVKEMRNKSNLHDLISLMIRYHKLLRPMFDSTSFMEIFNNNFYYPSELPIDGHQIMELGFDQKIVGEVLQALLDRKCKTIDQCKIVLDEVRYHW